jgi:hypothetical protein
MMKGRIRDLLGASPFAPFTIVMASGNEHRLEHPDFVALEREAADVTVEDLSGSSHILNPMLITEIRIDKTGGGVGGF